MDTRAASGKPNSASRYLGLGEKRRRESRGCHVFCDASHHRRGQTEYKSSPRVRPFSRALTEQVYRSRVLFPTGVSNWFLLSKLTRRASPGFLCPKKGPSSVTPAPAMASFPGRGACLSYCRSRRIYSAATNGPLLMSVNVSVLPLAALVYT